MAKGQQDGITILLGIKECEAGKVREGEEDFVVEVESLPKKRALSLLWVNIYLQKRQGQDKEGTT